MHPFRLFRVRKTPIALLTLAIASAALVGCTPLNTVGAPDCERDAQAAIGNLVTVEGAMKEEPNVSFNTPIHVQGTTMNDSITGSGAAVSSDTQLFSVDIVLYGGSDGRRLASTAYAGDQTAPRTLADWGAEIPGIAKALECATEGSRVIAGISPTDLGPDAAAAFGFAPNETAVAVLDLHRVFLPHAEGTLQFNARSGMPSVVRAPDGRPGITVPDAEAPEELVVQTLIKGTGEEITADSSVRMHYTGVLWDEGTVFDTSWDGAARNLGMQNVIPGFSEALIGQTVGSQVLIVVPPELGYGAEGNASVPANSTLVFVVDVLGLDVPNTQ